MLAQKKRIFLLDLDGVNLKKRGVFVFTFELNSYGFLKRRNHLIHNNEF